MKIAYIIYPDVIISNRSNGIRSQAETWAELLRQEGVEVDLINNWGNYYWKEYDAIHLFGGGRWIFSVVKRLSAINSKICWSPIYDPSNSPSIIDKTILYMGGFVNGFLKWNYLYQIRKELHVKKVLTRSNFEKEYLKKTFDVPKERIELITLSYSNYCMPYEKCEKEDFCLHISSIYQPRKNVIRLIEAAKKYNFKLVLAGNTGSEEQFSPIRDAIGSSKNIKVLGFISEEEKINLYKRAKVFALPSITEGVGIVAVDAAYYGCEIVITDIPGPKEYYKGQCIEVNPLEVDAIGTAIISFINDKVKFQPQLEQYIEKEYSGRKISQKLITVYESL